ncbi:glycosyltransferase 87 family protein [Streptomyces cellostaticus]|uniref:glycosyltransferase 87 family protein n=1 Tax=Streptomyces cellostaticus TaxID=67285 RepID=UPI0020267F3C|nr:glycosyltransferase 87 family protein [Streptomyces cellostaticus]
MADLLVYRAEGAAASHGGDLYGFTVTPWRLPATYPPFAAALFVPTTWIAVPALKAAFLTGNVLLLAGLVSLSARLASHPLPAPDALPPPRTRTPAPVHRWPLPPARLCTATALALWLEPVFQTLLFGQINLAVTCLVLWDLTRPPGARGKGLALGLATGVKLTPAIFIAYLLLRGRTREAATAAAAFTATVLLGALLLPAASAEFWTRRLYETGRVGKAWIVDNQSLQGLVARALHDPAPGACWVLTAAAAGAAGLCLAARARQDRHGILLTACTALLVSPISWSHHWVWCVPLLAVLLADGRPRLAAATAAVFTARTLWLVPHQGDGDLRLPWWQQPLASPYPLLGLALLAGAALTAAQPVPSARISSASTIR